MSDEESESTQKSEDEESDEEGGATPMSEDEEGGGEGRDILDFLEDNYKDQLIEETAALLFPRGNAPAERLQKVSEKLREQPRIDLSKAREALKELEPTKLLGETSQSSTQYQVPVKPEDVDFISTEFEITREDAEKVLCEHNGDVYEAAVTLLRAD